MNILRTLFKGLLILIAVLGLAVAALNAYRPGMDLYRAHAWPSTPAKPGALTVAWFGTDALLFSDGEHALMIDPFFSRPKGLINMATNASFSPDEPLIADWLKRAGVEKLDAVMVTHSHYDHSMDAGIVARITGAQLLGSESTANVGRGNGLPDLQLRVIRTGEPMMYGPFTITFVESKHAGATGGAPTGSITAPLRPPAHYLDYKLGAAYSILIAHPQGRILVHGSAGFEPGALKNYRADIAFIGVSIIDQIEPYIREVVDATGAKRVVPLHWDDFTRPLDQPLVPMALAVNLPKFFHYMDTRTDLRVQTLELGRTVPVFEQQGQ